MVTASDAGAAVEGVAVGVGGGVDAAASETKKVMVVVSIKLILLFSSIQLLTDPWSPFP